MTTSIYQQIAEAIQKGGLSAQADHHHLRITFSDNRVALLGDVNDTWMADIYGNFEQWQEGCETSGVIDTGIPAVNEDAEAIAAAFLAAVQPTPLNVGKMFTQVLRTWLTPAEFAEMRLKNIKHANDGICASHDYCDANMAMEQAFHNLGLQTCADLSEKGEDNPAWIASVDLWNAAWEWAKTHTLTAVRLEGIAMVEDGNELYMILGRAASMAEAVELARAYERIADPDHPVCNVPPNNYVLVSRDEQGYYSRRTPIML